jgi:hypothetical protein
MNWLRAHLQDAIDPLIDGDIYLVVLVILFDYNHWYLGVIGRAESVYNEILPRSKALPGILQPCETFSSSFYMECS